MACGALALEAGLDWARAQQKSCQEHAGGCVLACLGTWPCKLSFGNKTLKQGKEGLAVALGPRSGKDRSRHWTPKDDSDDSCNLHPLLQTRTCPGSWETAGARSPQVRRR